MFVLQSGILYNLGYFRSPVFIFTSHRSLNAYSELPRCDPRMLCSEGKQEGLFLVGEAGQKASKRK